jgi:phosphoribosylformimino-5-aminoimidazole carboxamide ribotide isomerase
MEIIPAIDLIEGKCVRLNQGDFDRKTIYNENPLEVALRFEDAGLGRLHLVDLDGARSGTLVNLKVLERLASKTALVIDFGGGIKTNADMRSVFDAGAAIACLGSIAFTNEALFFEWMHEYGSERILLGADVKEEKIAIAGWLEETETGILEYLEGKISKGLKQAFCTDIAKDGALQGPALELYKKVLARFPGFGLIASGGVSSVNDLMQLKEIGCLAAIVGKALYEGKIKLGELKKIRQVC